MKTTFLQTAILFLFICTASAQTAKTDSEVIKQENKRLNFFIGMGTSIAFGNLYQNPTVNLANNYVYIEKSQNLKTNLTLGISYTPYYRNIFDENGKPERITHGISFATFINPIALTKATENQSFFNMTDWGIGIGYKFAGSLMLMGTVEWLSARQPKEWFISEYGNNNKAYIVNNAPQIAFDINDDSIFRTKIITTFGFKVLYTFDVIKSYTNSVHK